MEFLHSLIINIWWAWHLRHFKNGVFGFAAAKWMRVGGGAFQDIVCQWYGKGMEEPSERSFAMMVRVLVTTERLERYAIRLFGLLFEGIWKVSGNFIVTYHFLGRIAELDWEFGNEFISRYVGS